MCADITQLEDDSEQVVERYYRKGDIDFCFLLNRRHHNLRVFDYRVGNYQQKRDFFDRIARSEGLRKVFTVVEKQDSKSWRSVGFSREGAIPGYFRTADAYVMSRVYTEEGEPIQGGAPKVNAPVVAPVKERDTAKPRNMALEVIEDVKRLKRVTDAQSTSSLYAPFRRGVFHPDVGVRGKLGKREYWVGAETDSSFGHAKVDLITPPAPDEDLSQYAICMHALLEELGKRETASVFGMCAIDETAAAQVFSDLGFKVSARLTDHVARGPEFIGIQIWHKRLSQHTGPRLPSFI